MCVVAAVVATHNRPELLAARSLPSIAGQTRPPDFLLVVDDSEPRFRLVNAEAVEGLTLAGTQVHYLGNFRTPGAAGAWNSALSWVQRNVPEAFVAILDDDDAWEPNYLERCGEKASRWHLDMVAAGLVFHEPGADHGRLLNPPPSLDVGDLLVRNTHIQGSNLFVRLHKLLEAGGFDEALASTTDRDLCIRLADLGTVRYGGLNEHLVHHHADGDRPRLSTPGSEAKAAGLRYFYRKHGCRMSPMQRTAFLDRSRRLFHCDPSESVDKPPQAAAVTETAAVEGHLDLVVGSVTSPDVGKMASLLDSLNNRLGQWEDVTLKVILLENGDHDPTSRNDLRAAVERASRQGMDVDVRTLERQESDAASGVFKVTAKELAHRKSIALSRTLLQHHLFLEAKPRPGSVVWILDDDVVLEDLLSSPDGSTRGGNIDYASEIKRLRQTGADIVLGEVTGDPPLPFLSCIRTQLVDLSHNLHHLADLPPGGLYPDRTSENGLARLDRPDYYYDLSLDGTDHLEMPFWYEPEGESSTAGQVFDEMVSRLPGILSGVQVFRPLVRNAPRDAVSGMVPSVHRGPSTLVFDLQALREFPNAVPSVGGSDTRRSDMLWCLLNQFAAGRKIYKAPLPVRQVRSVTANPMYGFETLLQDIRGHALYSSLSDVLRKKSEEFQSLGREPYGPHFLDLSDFEVRRATELYQDYLGRRVHAFEENYLRIMGLVSTLRRRCNPGLVGSSFPWWLNLVEYEASASALRGFVAVLESIYTQAGLDDLKRRVLEVDTGAIERFLKRLPDTVARYRSNTPLPVEELRKAAEKWVREEFSTAPLTYLGTGEEGVVLTDGNLVYKYFHYLNPRTRDNWLPLLRSIGGKLFGYRSLPDLHEVRIRGDHVTAVYTYEQGAKYEGGHMDGILTLLRECREAGIACRNIHPDNLLATPSGLKLIDLGADIVPYSDEEFRHMCRRAFLTHRFPFRSDLKRLMTKALTDDTLPELIGLEQFTHALDPRDLDELFYRPMEKFITAAAPGSVLDYGCGDGQLAERLSRQDITVTGYDPDPDAIGNCRELDSTFEYGGRDLLDRLLEGETRFDAVVCSRVLCTIEDDAELDTILKDLRSLAAEGGNIFVAVCNPFHLGTVSTELAEKHLPPGHNYREKFTYAKTLVVNGNQRTEVHRSFNAYRRVFSRAGLRIEGVREFDGTNVQSLEPASDHLVFRLRPLPSAMPRVSLLIKTCFMEWRIIERTIRHQVGQLEEPTPFVEKVVVVDTFEGPFNRQYDRPDPEAHRVAMDRLLADGVVDRVVYAPSDPEIIRAGYRRWFGAGSEATHSVNGQQLFATLYGFEACSGDYVLQLDSDLLIHRSGRDHDYIGEMVDVLRGDPHALFTSMSICREGPLPYTHEGTDGDWRVEVRGCLFDCRRLLSVLPVPNELADGRFALAWHRAFDRLILSSHFRNYRGGDPRTAFIHVPNDRKTDVDEWMTIVGALERGHLPALQTGKVELAGGIEDWAGPQRREPFVFVICGRNVEPGRFKRCFESLVAQANGEWGAVVVDDASTNGFGDYAEMLLCGHMDRVTLVRNEAPRGGLHNTWNAVTGFCVDPETVIITLDADDSLIGEHVVDRVREEYEDGADATVGSMLRLDKESHYPVNFDDPRRWDSNVWQHLRTFRKRLFDAIDVADLKLDGEWIDQATDWAFMVPIIEMAKSPRYIPEPLYRYEPASPKNDAGRRARDRVISRILGKAPYPRS